MMEGNHIHIRELKSEDAEALLHLQKENRAFFEKYSMLREDSFYTTKAQLDRIKKFEKGIKQDSEYNFGIFKNEDQELIGTVNLFQVLRGSLQSAIIGYFLDKQHNGQGFTTEAVQLLVKYAFEELDLHRVEAGVMPHNIGSLRVLEKAGFHKEGIARKNVKINGQWEDHQVLAVLNPED
ncbi:GNAT family N-acetyltransferase [Halobacillus ihumii]|uniref:GNAT family N-acetyltransferase n=1 Tax=Halobacillus ihumii TaxID=2686092 RepID=UPI0013D66618|nr:GNAT family protein [Halobacillus ihumii]